MTARDAVRRNYARLEDYLPNADTNMRVVCSWCCTMILNGSEPATHGMCARCERKQLADVAMTAILAYGTVMCRRGAGVTRPEDETDAALNRVIDAVFAIVDGGEK